MGEGGSGVKMMGKRVQILWKMRKRQRQVVSIGVSSGDRSVLGYPNILLPLIPFLVLSENAARTDFSKDSYIS